MKIFMMILLTISFNLHANECLELNKCIEYVSKLTGKKYIYDAKEVKGGFQATSNTQINDKNADNLFTYILEINGYTRVPTNENNTYLIVPTSDIRYQPTPTISVDSSNPPTILPNYDYYMMKFKFKNYKQGQMREASNSMRPFMSRYGRIIELKIAGVIAIQENAAQLVRAYEIIKSFDRILSKEEIQEQKEREIESKNELKIKMLQKAHEVVKEDKSK